MSLSAEQLRWFRLRRSGLVDPFDSPEAAAHALAGVQAQMLPAAGLALWNRLPAPFDQARYDALLNEQRSLIKLWGQRGTLHLYPAADWPLLIGALAEHRTWWERRVEKQGGDVAAHERLIHQVAARLEQEGTLGRSDLRAWEGLPLETWHLSAWGGLFADLVRRGIACHVPQAGGEGRFAHREHWLPDLPWEPPPPTEANVTLARRFFRSYGPATVQDLAYWRGARVAEARRWSQRLGEELVEVESTEGTLLAHRDDLAALHEAPPPGEAWPIRLLYRFDPLLLALKDKSWLIDLAHHGKVWRPAAHIEGTLLAHGRIVATWRYDRAATGLTITLRPFAPLPAAVRAAAQQQGEAVAAFFDLPLAAFDEEQP